MVKSMEEFDKWKITSVEIWAIQNFLTASWWRLRAKLEVIITWGNGIKNREIQNFPPFTSSSFFSVSTAVEISDQTTNQATKPLNSHNDTKNRIFTGQSKDRICWNPTWVVDRGGGGLGFVERMDARWTVRSSIFVETREHRERVLEKSPK